MILNTKPTDQVEFGNVSSGQEFKMKATAHSFRILSSGLYANKIRAIIREVPCNGRDAHNSVGKLDLPIDVHLPTSFEPHFSVRDYGTGLSHDDVIHLYTTYFESTKSNSVDDVGGFGLGCKSPFSYTDNFTVTSWFGGFKNIYTAYIGETGVPAMTLMQSVESDEPVGVEVRLSVRENDISTFRNEAEYVFSTFDTHPNVSGRYDKHENQIDTANIIEGVDLLKYGHSYRPSGAVAIMGGVAYPIVMPNPSENLGEVASLLRYDLNIKFQLGELDVQPSREGLSYDASTISAIKAKFDEINGALAGIVESKFDAMPNAWDRIDLISELRSNNFFKSALNVYLTTHSVEFLQGIMPQSYLKIDEKDCVKFNASLQIYNKNYSNKVHVEELKSLGLDDKNNQQFGYIIQLKTGTRFIHNNTGKRLSQRVRAYLRQAHRYGNDLVVVSPIDKTKPVDYNGFLQFTKQPKIITVDDLPVLEKRVVTKILSQSIMVSDCIKYSSSRWYETNSADINDTTKVHYYMPISNRTVVSPKFGNISLYDYLDMFDSYNKFSDMKIYGVRSSAMADIEKMGNWINFEEYASNLINKELTDLSIYDKLAVQSVRTDVLGFFDSSSISNVDKDSPYTLTFKFFEDMAKKNPYSETGVLALARKFIDSSKFDANAILHTKKVEVESMVDSIKSRYPLLAHLTRYIDRAEVANYINLIDQTKGV